MCDCGGAIILCEGIAKCSLCSTEVEDEQTSNIFRELGAFELTMYTDISLSIRHIATAMFKTVIALNIKRGSPRVGLTGACIYLASLHCNYPLTISEISKKINKKASYITTELKNLHIVLEQTMQEYDISITDDKYINRYILDINKMKPELDCEQYRKKLTSIINYMNDKDILISYHANTRICCILYKLLSKNNKISEKEFCSICPMSRNTFTKFNVAFSEYEYLINNSLLG